MVFNRRQTARFSPYRSLSHCIPYKYSEKKSDCKHYGTTERVCAALYTAGYYPVSLVGGTSASCENARA